MANLLRKTSKIQDILFKEIQQQQTYKFRENMGTLKSVCSSWFALISFDKYEHTHLRVPIPFIFFLIFNLLLPKIERCLKYFLDKISKGSNYYIGYVCSKVFELDMGTLKCVCSYLSRDIRANQLEHTLLRVPMKQSNLGPLFFFLNADSVIEKQLP